MNKKPYTATEVGLMRGFSPVNRARLCADNAARWEALSAVHARAGNHREADDAQSEAIALWDLRDEIYNF